MANLVSSGSPGGIVVKNPPASAGDARAAGFIPASERVPRVENGIPLQYSCLENSMDRGAQWAAVPGVTKSWMQPSTHTILFHIYPPSL